MPLSDAQLAILKADREANIPALNDEEATSHYNSLIEPPFYAWNSAVPINLILDATIWANFTPADPVNTSNQLNATIWQSRALACQGKQFNFQTIVLGKNFIDATKANIRQGLQDATTQIPSGAGGANQAAGWAAIQLILSRRITRAERLFATGTGTQASPAILSWEGEVTVTEVNRTR